MGCIGSRVALFRSCSFTSGSHSGSLTSSSGGVGSLGTGVAIGTGGDTDLATRRLSRRENVFSVQNVDDTGQGVSPGKLEVTETDIVLHVRGKLPLAWPLKSLRRYGFDNDLFSFECGRRCQTGAGIFAFRCHRAQSLFNLLQAQIQGGGEGGRGAGQGGTAVGGTGVSSSLPTLPSTPITPTNAGTPFSTTGGGGLPLITSLAATPVSSTFVYVNILENSSTRVISTSGAPPIPPPSLSSTTVTTSGSTSTSVTVTTTSTPDVVQTAGASHATMAVSSTSTSSSSSSRGPLLVSSSKPSLENHPVYMNVDSHGGALYAASANPVNYSNIPPPTAPRRISTVSEKSHLPLHQRLHPLVVNIGPSSSSPCSVLASGSSKQTAGDCALYSNVFCNQHTATIPILSGVPTSTGAIVVPLPIQQEPAELNYAELDLKPDRPSSSSSLTSPYISASGRLGLFNKHHQLISTYSKSAEPYNTSRLASISDDTLDGDSSIHPSSRLLGSGGLPSASASGSSSDQNNGELGYATIDFDKTAQLNVITRSKIALGFDDGDSKKGGSSLSKKLRYGTTGL